MRVNTIPYISVGLHDRIIGGRHKEGKIVTKKIL